MLVAVLLIQGACGSNGSPSVAKAPPVAAPAVPPAPAPVTTPVAPPAPALASAAGRIVLFIDGRFFAIDDPGGEVHEWAGEAHASKVLVRALRADRPVRQQIEDSLRGNPSLMGNWDAYDFEEVDGALVARNPYETYHRDEVTVIVFPDLGVFCAERTFDADAKHCRTLTAHAPVYTPPPPGDPDGLHEIVDDHPAFEIRYRRRPPHAPGFDHWLEGGDTLSVKAQWMEWRGDPARWLPISCSLGTTRGSVSLTDAWASCTHLGIQGQTLALGLVVGRRAARCRRSVAPRSGASPSGTRPWIARRRRPPRRSSGPLLGCAASTTVMSSR